VAGSFDAWGQISPYISSYFYHLTPAFRSSDLMILVPVSFFSESATNLMAGYSLKLFPPYWLIAIGAPLNCLILFLSSFITNGYLFAWVYGIGIGSLSSVIFLPGIWILWNHINSHKGLISGLMLFSYSLGAIIFGLVFTFVVNPDNEKAESIGEDGNEEEKMFTDSVADRVPMTIRWSVGLLMLFLCIGLVLVPRTWDASRAEHSESTLSLWNISQIQRSGTCFL
jgi:hypothetical protein